MPSLPQYLLSDAGRRPIANLVLERDEYVCQYCLFYARTVDHVVPKARGGGNIAENLVAACLECNRLKGDMRVVEFVFTYLGKAAPVVNEDPHAILRRIEKQTSRSVWRDTDTRWLRQWLRKEGWRGTDAERDGIDM